VHDSVTIHFSSATVPAVADLVLVRPMPRVDQYTIPKGITFHWGAPAKPMREERSRAVAVLVAGTPGIAAAYLPQCYAAGFVDPPAQVLVITLAPGADLATVMQTLGVGISRIFPPDEYLDILPRLDHDALQSVQESGTQIYDCGITQSRPWWKKVFSGGHAKA
jgi:hypothetical protein